MGSTKSVLLMGHADCDTMLTPKPVVNVQEAINYLKADFRSPLVKGLLEAYNSGCKDIIVFPVAPMNEYISDASLRLDPNPDFGGLNFYEMYYERLSDAYTLLMERDDFEIIVPIEAPFYDTGSVDFCTQLATHCEQAFLKNSTVVIGSMGTIVPDFINPIQRRSNYNDATISEMIADIRIPLLLDRGKFVMVTVGEGVFLHKQVPQSYNRSFEVVVASLLATTELDRSVIGKLLPNVLSTSFYDFTKEQIERLSLAKLNPVSKTAIGRKGAINQVKMMNDNTLGAEGSDFWSMHQMTLVATVANEIRKFGLIWIGKVQGFEEFRRTAAEYLDNLQSSGYVQQITYSIKRAVGDPYKAEVEIGIAPLYGVKNIMFRCEVGPGV